MAGEMGALRTGHLTGRCQRKATLTWGWRFSRCCWGVGGQERDGGGWSCRCCKGSQRAVAVLPEI